MDLDMDDLSTLPLDVSSRGRRDDEESSLIQRLQRAWISERCAPDILPYETRLIDAISTRLREQVSELISGCKCCVIVDKGEKIASIEASLMSECDSKNTFRTIIVQTEVERVKFLIRSYLRARLHKVHSTSPSLLMPTTRLTSTRNISFLPIKPSVSYP